MLATSLLGLPTNTGQSVGEKHGKYRMSDGTVKCETEFTQRE
jgi:hypothetical protein